MHLRVTYGQCIYMSFGSKVMVDRFNRFARLTTVTDRQSMLIGQLPPPRKGAPQPPTAAEIDPVVWGTPANFNGFRVLAALLHGM